MKKNTRNLLLAGGTGFLAWKFLLKKSVAYGGISISVGDKFADSSGMVSGKGPLHIEITGVSDTVIQAKVTDPIAGVSDMMAVSPAEAAGYVASGQWTKL